MATWVAPAVTVADSEDVRKKNKRPKGQFIREGAITKVLKVSRNNRYGILHFTTIIKTINFGGKCNEKVYY